MTAYSVRNPKTIDEALSITLTQSLTAGFQTQKVAFEWRKFDAAYLQDTSPSGVDTANMSIRYRLGGQPGRTSVSGLRQMAHAKER